MTQWPGVNNFQNFFIGVQPNIETPKKQRPQMVVKMIKQMMSRSIPRWFVNRRRYCTRSDTLMRVVLQM